ncbi:hypothetical protein D3C72_842940 [compost metagenome]
MEKALENQLNPFVALGVETRELSYSSAIARVLFANDDYLDALSRRLRLPIPLRFDSAAIRTEVSLGENQRLDVLGVDRLGRKVIIETKVCAPIDLAQQAKYVQTAKRNWPSDEILFLAYKFGPALLREHVPEFHLITSKDTLKDLPPGNHMGLRSMLEMFSKMEDRIEEDPAKTLLGSDSLDKAIKVLFAESIFHRLFKNFCDTTVSQLTGNPQVSSFKVTARGGKIIQIYDTEWLSIATGTQVHFELKDNQRAALHVETFPYPASSTRHLEAKARLVEWIRSALKHATVDGLDLVSPRRGWESASSTTIATIKIDFQNLSESVKRFSNVYNESHPHISAAFMSQKGLRSK